MKKLHNGQIVDMTAEEIADLENLVADANAKRQADEEAKQAKEALKTSAKAKLMATEYTPLTEEEANTIVL